MKESVIQGEPPSHCKKKARVEQKDSESLHRLPAGEGQGQNSPEFPSAAGGPETGAPESLLKCKFSKKTGKTVR